MKPRQCFTASRRRVLGKRVWMRLWRSGVLAGHPGAAVVLAAMVHEHALSRSIGPLGHDPPMTGRTTLRRSAMAGMRLDEGDGRPYAVYQNLAGVRRSLWARHVRGSGCNFCVPAYCLGILGQPSWPRQ